MVKANSDPKKHKLYKALVSFDDIRAFVSNI
jgi:hypothetical protein